MQNQPVSVLVVDDDNIGLMGVVMTLQKNSEFAVAGVAINGEDAVQKVAQLQPNVVLMDITMPVLDGIDATRQIAVSHPNVRVLMMSSHTFGTTVKACFDAGARGFFVKTDKAEPLFQAIRAVHSGSVWLDPSIDAHALASGTNHSAAPPPAPTSKISKVDELTDAGILAFKNGDYKAAIKRLQDATDLERNHWRAKLYLGMAYFKDDDRLLATMQFRHVQNNCPDIEIRKKADDAMKAMSVPDQQASALLPNMTCTMKKPAIANDKRGESSSGNRPAYTDQNRKKAKSESGDDFDWIG